MKRYSVLILVLLMVSAMTVAQTRTITGQVVDSADKQPIPGVTVLLKGSTSGVVTDANGEYEIKVPASKGTLVFSFIGYATQEIALGISNVINVAMVLDVTEMEEVIVVGYGSKPINDSLSESISTVLSGKAAGADVTGGRRSKSEYKSTGYIRRPAELQMNPNTEDYEGTEENIFHKVLKDPLSTFSIDVDAASYSNIRRFINNGTAPPKDAVRVEEMINYFTYNYDQPKNKDPFSVNTEISTAPWNKKHKLVHIGLQGKKIPTDNLPASNLVFLLDVSGSMNAPNKLPLLKSSFKMLVNNLRAVDRVAIVVYAGAAGVVLPSTKGSDKQAIYAALDNLSAGGSTAGGAGINLAYKIARENFVQNGNNRIILATDGDFNVGASSNESMEELIEEKRKDGVFLTVLGFGMGNYKDSKMEILADKGNGNYAYIDNFMEANKVLVNEFGGTLFTIAKDVKLQIEFNPAKVAAYRLIGYENRKLAAEDFNNDRKDAGELGSGHTVTALYEIIPSGVKSDFLPIDDLRYQETKVDESARLSKELMTIKLRYKLPDENKSKLIVHPVIDSQIEVGDTSDNFRWSAAVASFGMLLTDSGFKGNASIEGTLSLARSAKGEDEEGYRAEFIKMVRTFQVLARN